jgi:hypothetical protein
LIKSELLQKPVFILHQLCQSVHLQKAGYQIKQTEITEIANSLKVSKTLNVVDLQIEFFEICDRENQQTSLRKMRYQKKKKTTLVTMFTNPSFCIYILYSI